MTAPEPRYLTTGQVATRLEMPQRTVQSRAARGRIPGAWRMGPGDRWRIPVAYVASLRTRVVRR